MPKINRTEAAYVNDRIKPFIFEDAAYSDFKLRFLMNKLLKNISVIYKPDLRSTLHGHNLYFRRAHREITRSDPKKFQEYFEHHIKHPFFKRTFQDYKRKL